MLTLNIVGAGRVGQTLGRLWRDAGVCKLGGVLTRSPSSAREAVAFIGGGTAVSSCAALDPSDVTMLGVPDDAIQGVCDALVRRGAVAPDSIVFHCSGGLASEVLAAAAEAGARTASAHPVKSFAVPALAVQSFAETFCGVEGESSAVALLKSWFGELGARCFDIDPQHKTHYHAASVLVCNYLVSLMEQGFELYERAGVRRSLAAELVGPIMQETISNVLALGTVEALTGPIARGDKHMVERHLAVLRAEAPQAARVYAELGLAAVALARQSGRAEAPDLDAVERLLQAGLPREKGASG